MTFQKFLIYFIIINCVCSNYFNIVYRVIQISGGYNETFLKTKTNFYLVSSLCYLTATCIIILPIFTRRATPEELYNMTARIDQDLANFIKNESSAAGIDVEKYPIFRTQQYGMVAVFTALFIFILLARAIYRKKVWPKLLAKRANKTTEMMVCYRGFSIQILD